MKMTLKVKFNDGVEKDVAVKFADFVSFERIWSRSIAKFESELRLTDLAWLAWSAETRNGNTAKKFDPDWLETVDTIEPVGDEAGKTLPLESNP
jgi:hypothetical protein